MKTTENTILEPVLMVNSAYGVYIPQTFIETSSEEILKQIPEDIKRDLLEGPDHENYWDSYDSLLNITFKHNSQKLFLEAVEDLWLIPACYMRTKEYKENWNC